MNFEVAVGLLLIAAVLFPFARLAADPDIARSFPRISIVFGFLVLAGVLVAGWTAWRAPWLLRPAATLAFVAIVWHGWRARPAYGLSQGLPPGSLRVIPVGAWTDVAYFQKQARLHGPVFKVSHFFKPMVCIVGLKRGLDVLRRYEDTAIRSPAPPFARFLPCGFLRGMVGKTHERYRPIIRNSITSAALEAIEPFAAVQARAALQAVAGEAARSSTGAFAPPHWDRLLFTVFSRLFFGIDDRDPDREEVTRLFALVKAAGKRTISLPWLPAERRIRAAVTRLHAILTARCAAWSAALERGEAIPVCLLSEILRADPAFVRDPEVTGLLVFMTDAAARDLAGLLQWIVKMLCDNQAVVAELRDEVTRGVDQRPKSSLAHRIIWETLRLEQSEHIYREVLDDIDVGEFKIPKGWLLRICVHESHRLPDVFANPDAFNPARFLERPFARHEFAPLGAFRHACLGDTVTTTVARIVITEIVRGYEFAQAGKSRRDFNGWHWTPGSDFRVAFRPHIDSRSSL